MGTGTDTRSLAEVIEELDPLLEGLEGTPGIRPGRRGIPFLPVHGGRVIEAGRPAPLPPSIVEYSATKPPANRYPRWIVSPPAAGLCCLRGMAPLGELQPVPGRPFEIVYARCGRCGYTVRRILAADAATWPAQPFGGANGSAREKNDRHRLARTGPARRRRAKPWG